MKIGGIILCGGQSLRMGQAKAWLPFGGELMLQRVTRLVSDSVAPVVVVAAPGQEIPLLQPDIVIVHDAVSGRGPLQGLDAGLQALAGQVDAVFLSSGDAPFLQPRFITRMIELLDDFEIAAPEFNGHKHPLAAVYRVSVAPVVRELLAADRLPMRALFDCCRTRFVPPEELVAVDPDLRSLRNLNTPEEYAAALSTL